MIKLLGYDFVTKEKLKWFKQKDLIIDDVAVVRRNRQAAYQHRRSGSTIMEDTCVEHFSILNRPHRHSLQPDSLSLLNDNLGAMPSPYSECEEDGFRLEQATSSAETTTLGSSWKGPNSKSGISTGRSRLFGFASKGFKVPFANFRRLSEPGGMNVVASGSGELGVTNNTQLVQRCVIIQRDDSGYGLTVSGDNPVFVQSVKEDGAAARAGVRQGDRIIKVNGTLVTNANHMDVVKLISAGSHVALTLLGRPSHTFSGTQQRPVSLLHQTSSDRLIPVQRIESATYPSGMHRPISTSSHQHLPCVGSPPSTSSTGSGSSPSPCGQATSSGSSAAGVSVRRSATTVGTSCVPFTHTGKEFITGPQPVDEQKQAEWKKKRILIIQQMLEEEKKHVEELRSELKVNPNSDKTQQSYEQAQKRIRNLENQLSDFASMPMTTSGGSKNAAQSPSKAGRQLKQADAATKQTSSKTRPQQSGHPVESTGHGPPSNNHSSKEHTIHFISPAQIDVIPMEESDSDTETAAPLDTEGPFSNFAELKGRPAHLAVFLHYLISNSDPASLLFYLVTDLYTQGGGKELRKWAYEIHSSFLVPTAPLRVSCTENEVWQEVENVFDSSNAWESEEVMKRLFIRARHKALDEINEHLADFRSKRTLGLGNVFGESMLQGLVQGDTVREKKIVDALLTQHFESFFSGVSDFDSLPDRLQVLAASLATVLRHMGVKPNLSLHEKLLDKCPSYAAKEKSRFGRPLLAKPSKKAVQVKGHHFLPHPVYSSTKCYQCSDMVWGLNAQAYFCSNCDVVVHKQCAGSLEDACYSSGSNRRSLNAQHIGGKKLVPKNVSASHLPSTPTNRSSNDGAGTDSTLSTPSPVGCPTPAVSIPTKSQQHMRQPRRHVIAEEPEDGASVSESVPTGTFSASNHNVQISADDMDEVSDQPTELPYSPPVDNASGSAWPNKATWSSSDSGYGGDANLTVAAANNAAAVIGRSQSMKSRDEQVRTTRKNSTESNGRRTKSDVDADDKSIAIAQVVTGEQQQVPQITATTADMSVSSSSSSVSRSSLPDSPTASTDALRPHRHESAASGQSPQSSATLIASPQLASTPSAESSLATAGTVVLAGSDSDLEAETECPLLEDVLDWETIRHLKPKEKKRQEVINELFHTERTHVRNLKVLTKIFYERLLAYQILPPDFVKLLFSNIEEVLDIHVKMNAAMKALTKKSKLVGDIGDMMLEFFDGEQGENFRRSVATFCQHQQYALEALKLRQKKDQKLAQFLQEAEGSPVCRKLQLKDMLPMEMQRLTKYPLLLETVAKYTPEPSDEGEKLHKCNECARAILNTVNTAKRKSENARRLEDLQRRLDTTAFDKVQHTTLQDYKCLDLRNYRLVHDGPLTWRLGKNKAVDLHVVLLEDLLVLLTRNSDGQRLSLRFHNITFVSGKDDTKYTHCPLLKLSSLMAKNVATDKKAFFLVCTSATGPQIYELVAGSTAEKKTWFKFLTEQIDVCKRNEAIASANARAAASAGGLAANAASGPAKTPTQAPLAEPSPVDQPPEAAPLNQSARRLSEAGLTLSAAAAAASTHVEDELAPVERVQIISQPRLINPSEVMICQPTILEHAEPVLTPLERLRRKDDAIMRALLDKQKILAKIFDLPCEELDLVAESVMESKGANKEARELALAAIVQTNRLLEAINASMKLRQEEEKTSRETSASGSGESGAGAGASANSPARSTSPPLRLVVTEKPAVPCSKLTLIAAPLMKHLSSLLHSLQFMEDDLKRVRQELHQYKERADETSENASPAGSMRKQSSSSSCSAPTGGKGVQNASRSSKTEPAPTTNIDEYLAKSGGKRTESVERSGKNDGKGEASDRTTRQSNSPQRQTGAETASPASANENPEKPMDTRPSQAVTSPSNGMKSPESCGEGDEEKRRERRRQKRQRHTALSGLESGSPKHFVQDRKSSVDERKGESSEESPLGAVPEQTEK